MSRNLADLQAECAKLGLKVEKPVGREGKAPYEKALCDYMWSTSNPGQDLPEQIPPMLARNCKDLLDSEVESMMSDGSSWVMQEKINGCRCEIKVRNPRKGRINYITSRRVSDETYRLSEMHDQMPHYRDMELGDEWEDTIIDGEILMPVPVVDTSIVDGKGVKTLDILQATAATLNCDAVKSIAIQAKFGKLVHHAFDCLRFKGKDIRDLPYVVLTKDKKEIDRTKESRFLYLEQVVVRVIEVLGEQPCAHCEGVRYVEASKEAAKINVEQEDFMSLLGG